jgi:lipopolysaccharide/colanic/teichoic acid biosynthesis glycosyltransferase
MVTEQIGELAVPQVAASKSYLVLKRGLDLVVAVTALIVLGPVMLAVAAAIALTSQGPVVFRQARIGRGGQPFTCYKFRTMSTDADPNVHRAYIEAYAQGQANGQLGNDAAPFKMVRDNRVTPVGRFLRRTSLDELPQLVNVLRGEMSIVGPRPDVAYSVALYKDWHKLRLAVQPGLTGLWQVEGRGRVSYDEGMRLDLEYVRRQSLWLDIQIILKTIPAVLSMRGAA